MLSYADDTVIYCIYHSFTANYSFSSNWLFHLWNSRPKDMSQNTVLTWGENRRLTLKLRLQLFDTWQINLHDGNKYRLRRYITFLEETQLWWSISACKPKTCRTLRKTPDWVQIFTTVGKTNWAEKMFNCSLRDSRYRRSTSLTSHELKSPVDVRKCLSFFLSCLCH